MHIREVNIFTNGMVMAFDENGQQVAKCQGFIFEVVKSLVKYCDEKTHFNFMSWKNWTEECDFSWWFKKAKVQDKEGTHLTR